MPVTYQSKASKVEGHTPRAAVRPGLVDVGSKFYNALGVMLHRFETIWIKLIIAESPVETLVLRVSGQADWLDQDILPTVLFPCNA